MVYGLSAHHKIIRVDGATIFTGSFNFMKAAQEHHAENMLVIHGQGDLMAAYLKNFEAHLGHWEKYAGRPIEDR